MSRIGIGPAELLPIVFIVIVWVLYVSIYWRIFSKAGFSGWLGLTQMVPILNFVILVWLALTEWPVERELKSLKQDSKK